MNPHGDINLHQVLAEIVPGAVGPVACIGIDMLTDPITQQGFHITVDVRSTPAFLNSSMRMMVLSVVISTPGCSAMTVMGAMVTGSSLAIDGSSALSAVVYTWSRAPKTNK
jgi:hypothetical protein